MGPQQSGGFGGGGGGGVQGALSEVGLVPTSSGGATKPRTPLTPIRGPEVPVEARPPSARKAAAPCPADAGAAPGAPEEEASGAAAQEEASAEPANPDAEESKQGVEEGSSGAVRTPVPTGLAAQPPTPLAPRMAHSSLAEGGEPAGGPGDTSASSATASIPSTAYDTPMHSVHFVRKRLSFSEDRGGESANASAAAPFEIDASGG